MRLYLAGRFASGPTLDGYGLEAAEHGHIITSRWHSGDHGDPAAEWSIDDPSLPRYAWEDVHDLRDAEVVVSFTEGGGGKGGRHVEYGLGLALDKRLVIVGPREHVFHTLHRVEQFDTWEAALAHLDRVDDALAEVGGARDLDGTPAAATMDDGTILGRQTARTLGIAGNGPPPRTTRYYLGVVDSGLKVSTAITARWTDEPRPLPVSALREDLEAATGLYVLDPLLVADGSPLLWPVSREVYAAWNDLDVNDLDYTDELVDELEDNDRDVAAEQRERDQHEADALAASAEADAADEAWQRHQDEDVTR